MYLAVYVVLFPRTAAPCKWPVDTPLMAKLLIQITDLYLDPYQKKREEIPIGYTGFPCPTPQCPLLTTVNYQVSQHFITDRRCSRQLLHDGLLPDFAHDRARF
jgi:hypothetical protein